MSGADLDRPLRLNPAVGLRPEPFGALAYHFDSRRLVFLKSTAMVSLVESLEDHPSAAAAIDAAVETDTIPANRRAAVERALISLLESEVVCEH